jgi:hypothetical protein
MKESFASIKFSQVDLILHCRPQMRHVGLQQGFHERFLVEQAADILAIFIPQDVQLGIQRLDAAFVTTLILFGQMLVHIHVPHALLKFLAQNNCSVCSFHKAPHICICKSFSLQQDIASSLELLQNFTAK